MYQREETNNYNSYSDYGQNKLFKYLQLLPFFSI